MSYRLWIKSLPKTLGPMLREPTSLAIIASVGVHGLMWVVLPLLPVQSSQAEEPEIRRSVALLELTPAEQGRLPDFSTPQVTVPPVPEESDFYSLTPLPNPYSPAPTQPSSPNYQTFPPIVLPQLPPPPQYSYRRPNPLFQRRTGIVIPPDPPPEATGPSPTPSVTPSVTPSATPSAPPGAEGLNPNTNSGQPNPSNPTPAPSGTPPTAPSDRIARLQQEQQQLRELYRFNGTGTGTGYGVESSGRWFTDALRQSPEDLDRVPRHELEIAPPRGACLFRAPQAPGEAWFGVVLDGEGSFAGQPTKLRSSGYEAFDQQALAAIAQYDFTQDSANDKPDFVIQEGYRIYYVEVKFAQPNCPSPGAAPSGAAPSSQG
ncbi:MAG: hypothetical protein SFY66_05950 [Oculatellaceae cyanobacterium bins.114]|nr:hypothetical protein [Oculatellaceae cyanobacterium bins.114]